MDIRCSVALDPVDSMTRPDGDPGSVVRWSFFCVGVEQQSPGQGRDHLRSGHRATDGHSVPMGGLAPLEIMKLWLWTSRTIVPPESPIPGSWHLRASVDRRVRERRSARVKGIARRNLSYVPIEFLLRVVRPQPSPQTLPSRLTDGRRACQARSQFRPEHSPVLLTLHTEPAARPPDPGVR